MHDSTVFLESNCYTGLSFKRYQPTSCSLLQMNEKEKEGSSLTAQLKFKLS